MALPKWPMIRVWAVVLEFLFSYEGYASSFNFAPGPWSIALPSLWNLLHAGRSNVKGQQSDCDDNVCKAEELGGGVSVLG